jgi:hypothetical protein
LDEFSNLKGHKEFITTVVDLDKKIWLDVIKGHKQMDVFNPFNGSKTQTINIHFQTFPFHFFKNNLSGVHKPL